MPLVKAGFHDDLRYDLSVSSNNFIILSPKKVDFYSYLLRAGLISFCITASYSCQFQLMIMNIN